MNASPVEPLAAFVEAAAQAEDCILVLDGWLFMLDDALATEARIKQVLDWLPPDTAVNHVKLLTSGGDAFYRRYVDERVAEHVRLINQLNPRRPQPLEAEVNWHLEKNFPRVHDRFAIIDNELWHFGSTVGGLHAKVSAATRGWDAEKHDALRFFREAWAGDSDPGGRRRHG